MARFEQPNPKIVSISERVKRRSEALGASTDALLARLQEAKSDESVIAAVLSMHELVNGMAAAAETDAREQRDSYILELRDAIRGLHDGLVMGDSGAREKQRSVLRAGSLRAEVRAALKRVSGDAGIGPLETTMTSESIV